LSEWADLDSYKTMKLLILLLAISCQGYQFQTKKNPFAKYGISSIAVENFYNYSNLNNLSPSFSKEMTLMLSGFSKLKVLNNFKDADAVLVGVLTTQDTRRQSRVRSDEIGAKSILKDRIGNSRNDYYIPTKTRLSAKLKIVIIKNYSKRDLELLQSEGEIIDPRVVFTELLDLSEIYTREVLAGASNNFTLTRAQGAEKNAIETMAQNAANTFREMILYAF